MTLVRYFGRFITHACQLRRQTSGTAVKEAGNSSYLFFYAIANSASLNNGAPFGANGRLWNSEIIGAVFEKPGKSAITSFFAILAAQHDLQIISLYISHFDCRRVKPIKYNRHEKSS